MTTSPASASSSPAAGGDRRRARRELRARGAEVVTADLRPGADVTCDVSDADQVDDLFAGPAPSTGW